MGNRARYSVCLRVDVLSSAGSVVKVERKGSAFVQRSFEEFHKLHCKLRLICRGTSVLFSFSLRSI